MTPARPHRTQEAKAQETKEAHHARTPTTRPDITRTRRPTTTTNPRPGHRGLRARSPHLPSTRRFRCKSSGRKSRHVRGGRGRLRGFLGPQARELLDWHDDFHTTLRWNPPFAEWFAGGTLNASYNCLDRHVEAGRGSRVAFHWEGEPGDTRTITYSELLQDVQRFAGVLQNLGLTRGDRVAVYMPMIPELVVTMLACARIGVAHSVIFGGFSPDAITDRCADAEARLVVTADAGYRRGEPSPLKPKVDLALSSGAPTVEHVIVVDRCGTAPAMNAGRDLWWHDLMPEASREPTTDPRTTRQPSPHTPPHDPTTDMSATAATAEPMDSEQLLYLLYTSGTTAKPKGIMHTTGGYLTQVAFTHRYVFDLRPDTDVYWCAADIGWVTGHSYIVYGPLANGCTSVMYEGTPDTPRQAERHGESPAQWPKDRLWDIVERYGVTQLYTAPTAIRTFMRWGERWPTGRDLSSLRVLGTVGEPINPEAWMWYHRNIGGERCPIVDTWWQTETGGHMISPLPGVTATKPGSATQPLPGRVRRGGGRLRRTGEQRRRLSHHHPPLAIDAAGHLGRPAALPRHLLVGLPGPLLRRRRRPHRR